MLGAAATTHSEPAFCPQSPLVGRARSPVPGARASEAVATPCWVGLCSGRGAVPGPRQQVLPPFPLGVLAAVCWWHELRDSSLLVQTVGLFSCAPCQGSSCCSPLSVSPLGSHQVTPPGTSCSNCSSVIPCPPPSRVSQLSLIRVTWGTGDPYSCPGPPSPVCESGSGVDLGDLNVASRSGNSYGKVVVEEDLGTPV